MSDVLQAIVIGSASFFFALTFARWKLERPFPKWFLPTMAGVWAFCMVPFLAALIVLWVNE